MRRRNILERKFGFDSVYDEHITQQDLYKSISNGNRVSICVSMHFWTGIIPLSWRSGGKKVKAI